jgi:hypothetical protein
MIELINQITPGRVSVEGMSQLGTFVRPMGNLPQTRGPKKPIMAANLLASEPLTFRLIVSVMQQ